MQDFLQGHFDDTNESIQRFEAMNQHLREQYFDVHEVENMFDYYLETNQMDLAEQILSIGLKQHPDAIPLQIKLSIVLSEQGFFDEALEIIEYHLKFEPQSPELLMSMGWLCLKKGDDVTALKYFDETLRFAGNEEESFLLDIGFNLNQEGCFELAVDYLRKGCDRYPHNENMWFELAYAYERTEDDEAGIEAYSTLLDMNPFFDNAWYNLGILYNRTGQFAKAIEAYEFSIAIVSDHSESFFNMGNSYAHLDQFEMALDCYLTYASYGFENTMTFQYIGECLEQLGQVDKAIRYYEMVIEHNPQFADAWYGIGTSLMNSSRIAESIYPLEQAVRLQPKNPDYCFALGKAYRELMAYDKAIACIEKGLMQDPEEIWAWIELVQLHTEKDPLFNFIEFIDRALVEYPTVGAVSYMAAVIYFKFAQDKDLALGYLKVGRRRQPDDLQVVLTEFPELLNAPEITKLINKKAKNVK
ncbi:MAG: tetratricopeptide repeat protein [Marinilabiliaceae bacterium]|nr:tetratricopeptide repeat protein [Marinilabiliaceae bacterium]